MQYDPRSRPPKPRIDDPELEQIRRAFNRAVTSVIDGKKVKMRSIDFAFTNYAHEAAQGNMSSAREIEFYLKMMPGYNPLRQVAIDEVRSSEQEHDQLTAFGGVIRTMAYHQLNPIIVAEYRDHLGLDVDLPNKPPLVDCPEAIALIKKVERKRRVPGTAYEVGRGKPPVGTRFRPGECGRLRKKVKPHEQSDGWSRLREEVMRTRRMNEGGKVVQVRSLEVAVVQVLRNAIKGDRLARSLLRRLTAALHQANLLDPIPKRKLKPKISPDRLEQTERAYGFAKIVIWLDLKVELIEAYEDRYGQTTPRLYDMYEKAKTEKEQALNRFNNDPDMIKLMTESDRGDRP